MVSDLKPVTENVILYPGPGGTLGIMYDPTALVTALKVLFVEGFSSTTFTLGMTAPLGSVTTPVMEA